VRWDIPGKCASPLGPGVARTVICVVSVKSVISLVTLLLPALAVAAPRQIEATGPNQDDLRFARVVVPSTGVTELAASRIIYLNRTGITLRPGTEDARANTSSLVTQQATLPGWNTDAATWASTVSCMRDMFARFDVSIVDQDPGNIPHIEAVFGGSPTAIGMDANFAGVSPFTADCSVIENSIVFTFTAVLPNDPRLMCEIMAQEVAHSYGLDHELLASDPMTYLEYAGEREFKDVAAKCGEDTERPCGVTGYPMCWPTQNSVQLLKQRLGESDGDNVAPVVGITSPPPNATVPPGFQVRASASDNKVVKYAQLYVDGEPVGTAKTGAGPFVFTTTSSLREGEHTLKIEVSDGRNLDEQTISVTVKKGAASPDGGVIDNTDVLGGCAAGGSGASALVGCLAMLLRRRRR